MNTESIGAPSIFWQSNITKNKPQERKKKNNNERGLTERFERTLKI